MPLNQFQKKWCLDLLEKLMSFSVSKPFRADVTMNTTNELNSNSVYIKTPMSLGTVKRKLENDEYETVTDWGNDIRLIWSNANASYREESPHIAIANYLSKWFDKHFQKFPQNEEDEWMIRYQNAQKDVAKLMKEFPQH